MAGYNLHTITSLEHIVDQLCDEDTIQTSEAKHNIDGQEMSQAVHHIQQAIFCLRCAENPNLRSNNK